MTDSTVKHPVGVRAEAQVLSFELLYETQQRAYLRALDLLREMSADQSQGIVELPEYLPRLELRRWNRVIVIDGERGAGKTTVLLSILRGLVDAHLGQVTAQPQQVQRRLSDLAASVVPLGIVDLDPLPRNVPVVVALAHSLRAYAEHMTRVGSPMNAGRDERDPFGLEHPDEVDQWDRWMEQAAETWPAIGLDRFAGESKAAFAAESRATGDAYARLSVDFRARVDALSALGPRQRSRASDPLFVVTIDDADMAVERAVEVLTALRTLHHPRVAFLMTADAPLIVERVARAHAELLPDRRSRTLAREMVDKVLPSSHRCAIPGMTGREAWAAVDASRLEGTAAALLFELAPFSAALTGALPQRPRALADITAALDSLPVGADGRARHLAYRALEQAYALEEGLPAGLRESIAWEEWPLRNLPALAWTDTVTRSSIYGARNERVAIIHRDHDVVVPGESASATRAIARAVMLTQAVAVLDAISGTPGTRFDRAMDGGNDERPVHLSVETDVDGVLIRVDWPELCPPRVAWRLAASAIWQRSVGAEAGKWQDRDHLSRQYIRAQLGADEALQFGPRTEWGSPLAMRRALKRAASTHAAYLLLLLAPEYGVGRQVASEIAAELPPSAQTVETIATVHWLRRAALRRCLDENSLGDRGGEHLNEITERLDKLGQDTPWAEMPGPPTHDGAGSVSVERLAQALRRVRADAPFVPVGRSYITLADYLSPLRARLLMESPAARLAAFREIAATAPEGGADRVLRDAWLNCASDLELKLENWRLRVRNGALEVARLDRVSPTTIAGRDVLSLPVEGNRDVHFAALEVTRAPDVSTGLGDVILRMAADRVHDRDDSYGMLWDYPARWPGVTSRSEWVAAFRWPVPAFRAPLDHEDLAVAWSELLREVGANATADISEDPASRAQWVDATAVWFLGQCRAQLVRNTSPPFSLDPVDDHALQELLAPVPERNKGPSTRRDAYQHWRDCLFLLAVPEAGTSTGLAARILGIGGFEDWATSELDETRWEWLQMCGVPDPQVVAAEVERAFPDHPWTKFIGLRRGGVAPTESNG